MHIHLYNIDSFFNRDVHICNYLIRNKVCMDKITHETCSFNPIRFLKNDFGTFEVE